MSFVCSKSKGMGAWDNNNCNIYHANHLGILWQLAMPIERKGYREWEEERSHVGLTLSNKWPITKEVTFVGYESSTWSEVVKPLIMSPPIIAIPFSPSGCRITAYQRKTRISETPKRTCLKPCSCLAKSTRVQEWYLCIWRQKWQLRFPRIKREVGQVALCRFR